MYDVIVVGAGAMGSSSAYFLSRQGLNVALIEQYELGHEQGSSHGASRIIRMAYKEDHFAKMMPEAYKLWKNIEEISGRKLIHKTGGLDFGDKNDRNLQELISTLERRGIRHEVLNSDQLKKRFPGLLIDENDIGVFQEDAGIINASVAVSTFQEMAKNQGVDLLPQTPLTDITQKNGVYIIRSEDKVFETKKVVLTTGAWTKLILNKHFDIDFEFEVLQPCYAFWKISVDHYHDFPIFIHWGDEVYYGFPEHEEKGSLKIAIHVSDNIPRVDPNNRKSSTNPELLAKISLFIEKTFSDIDTSPLYAVSCLYAMRPDENFIMEEIRDSLFVVSGFSGHGFKFTPLIGKITSDLVLGLPPQFDLSHFKL